MRTAILGGWVEQEDALAHRGAMTCGGVERLAFDVEDDQGALPREAIRDGEAAGLPRAGAGMQGHMFAATEAQKLATPRFAENDVVFEHQKKLLEDWMPPERSSASVAHALLP